ncbi:MOSC domain-containing protein [Virgibacillus ainsalahensis]
MDEPHVHKIFQGNVKEIPETGRTNRPWEITMSAYKSIENVWLSETGISEVDGPQRTPDKAVFSYPIKHYTDWKEEFAVEAIDMGAMGEHFVVLEMDEFTVCIGDTFKIGEALIQVSQPGLPYLDSSTPFRQIDFARQIQKSGRTGWYFRVLQEGNVQAVSDLELMERPYPQWSIAACNEILHVYKEDLRLAADLASCELLGKSWQRALQKRVRGF